MAKSKESRPTDLSDLFRAERKENPRALDRALALLYINTRIRLYGSVSGRQKRRRTNGKA